MVFEKFRGGDRLRVTVKGVVDFEGVMIGMFPHLVDGVENAYILMECDRAEDLEILRRDAPEGLRRLLVFDRPHYTASKQECVLGFAVRAQKGPEVQIRKLPPASAPGEKTYSESRRTIVDFASSEGWTTVGSGGKPMKWTSAQGGGAASYSSSSSGTSSSYAAMAAGASKGSSKSKSKANSPKPPTTRAVAQAQAQAREDTALAQQRSLIEGAREQALVIGMAVPDHVLRQGAKRHNNVESLVCWCLEHPDGVVEPAEKNAAVDIRYRTPQPTTTTPVTPSVTPPVPVPVPPLPSTWGHVLLAPNFTYGLRCALSALSGPMSRREVRLDHTHVLQPWTFYLDGDLFVKVKGRRQLYARPCKAWFSYGGSYGVDLVTEAELPTPRAVWSILETGAITARIPHDGTFVLEARPGSNEVKLVPFAGHSANHAAWAFRRDQEPLDADEKAQLRRAEEESAEIAARDASKRQQEEDELTDAIAESTLVVADNLVVAKEEDPLIPGRQEKALMDFLAGASEDDDVKSDAGSSSLSPPPPREEMTTTETSAVAAAKENRAPPGNSRSVVARPAVAELQPMVDLVEYLGRFRAGVGSIVRSLRCEKFAAWRGVRGDGNCYYRAVAFATIEALLRRGDIGVLGKVVDTLSDVNVADVWGDDDAPSVAERDHDRLIKYLRGLIDEVALLSSSSSSSSSSRRRRRQPKKQSITWTAPQEEEEEEEEEEAKGECAPSPARRFADAIASDPTLDLSLVRAARCLVFDFLRAYGSDPVDVARARLVASRARLYGGTSPSLALGGTTTPKTDDDASASASASAAASASASAAPPPSSSADDLTVAAALGVFLEEPEEGVFSESEPLRLVRTLGEDAEGLVADLGVLPKLVGGDCQIWGLFDDRATPVGSGHDDTDETKGVVKINIVLNPGHYFLLYRASDLEKKDLPFSDNEVPMPRRHHPRGGDPSPTSSRAAPPPPPPKGGRARNAAIGRETAIVKMDQVADSRKRKIEQLVKRMPREHLVEYVLEERLVHVAAELDHLTLAEIRDLAISRA